MKTPAGRGFGRRAELSDDEVAEIRAMLDKKSWLLRYSLHWKERDGNDE